MDTSVGVNSAREGQGNYGMDYEQALEYGRKITASLNSAPQNISETERWGSLGLGGLLLLSGLMRGKFSGLLMGVVGGALLHRGITGHCYGYEAMGVNTAEHKGSTSVPAQEGFKIEQSVVINRPPEELYRFWRNLENLPQVMRHIKEVHPHGNNRSHWIATGIAGENMEWEAEIINERENELIAWRSLPGGTVDTAGSVHFKQLPGQQATELTVSLKYNPPGGKVGAGIASMFGSGVEHKVQEDLLRFKERMESQPASLESQQPASNWSMEAGI